MNEITQEEALRNDCEVQEALPPLPRRSVARVLQQIHVRAHRRSNGR